jgi:hypothetical protein
MPGLLPISYPGNNGTGYFSYEFEAAQFHFRLHITCWELYQGTAKDLPNAEGDSDDQSQLHRTVLLTFLYLKQFLCN